jgi:hypothetical protein
MDIVAAAPRRGRVLFGVSASADDTQLRQRYLVDVCSTGVEEIKDSIARVRACAFTMCSAGFPSRRKFAI